MGDALSVLWTYTCTSVDMCINKLEERIAKLIAEQEETVEEKVMQFREVLNSKIYALNKYISEQNETIEE